MKKGLLTIVATIVVGLVMFSVVLPRILVSAEEVETPIEIEPDAPYELVDDAYCTLSISSGNASVNSVVIGAAGTTSVSVTVYLEKLVNGSWQPYTSWSHSGGRSIDNTDSTSVSHGAYRVWMSVNATATGGSESFNVNGNTTGY